MTSTHLSVLMATFIVSGASFAQPVQSQVPLVQIGGRAIQEQCDNRQHIDVDDCRRGRRARSDDDRHGYRANPVPVLASSVPQHPAYGWQYFSDPRAVHAVVISPTGEYFLSRGRGMQQVTGPAGSPLSR